jgi:hypothetical protein
MSQLLDVLRQRDIGISDPGPYKTIMGQTGIWNLPKDAAVWLHLAFSAMFNTFPTDSPSYSVVPVKE